MSDDHMPRWLERFRAGELTLLNTDQPRRRSLESLPSTARQRLVESSGTPFAPAADVRPVVCVMDGRKRNDEIEPTAWRRALETAEGTVAIYFEIAGDHEWWLAYDPDAADDLDGPYQRWTTNPSGPWEYAALPAGILEHNLEDLYWVGDEPIDKCDIRRSKVVCLEDAPEFVQREVNNRD